jgi:hypothetical protein
METLATLKRDLNAILVHLTLSAIALTRAHCGDRGNKVMAVPSVNLTRGISERDSDITHACIFCLAKSL